jgi:signal transduction histidine kinase
MKLIHKTSRYYLGFTLFTLSVGTVLFYFLIKIVLMDSIDEALHQEELQIIENLQYEKDFESLEPSENIFIQSVRTDHIVPEKYATIEVYDSLGNTEHYRELKAIYKHAGKFYEISIRQSLVEAETLLFSLLPAVALLFLFILAGVLVINRYVSNKVWNPFYELVERLKEYDIIKNKVITYHHSEITEFNELSLSLEKMTNKIYKDFLSQKEFNENSSHEMQTPLAIIRNKLELLIQSQNLKEQELSLIESVFEAVKRLTLLNKGLLLISKIENNQFHDVEKVEMEMLLKNSLKNFEDQIQDKHLTLEIQTLNPCVLNFNIILGDILLTNIISNAIKHNVVGGKIYIELQDNYLKIENTGKALTIDPLLLFERFRKNSDAENSIGLGLAIVKKICDMFNYRIEYLTEKNNHSITIYFS